MNINDFGGKFFPLKGSDKSEPNSKGQCKNSSSGLFNTDLSCLSTGFEKSAVKEQKNCTNSSNNFGNEYKKVSAIINSKSPNASRRMELGMKKLEGKATPEEMAELDKLNEQEEARQAKIKNTQKASNGLTYNEALAIIDKLVAKYSGKDTKWNYWENDKGRILGIKREGCLEEVMTDEDKQLLQKAHNAMNELSEKYGLRDTTGRANVFGDDDAYSRYGARSTEIKTGKPLYNW